VQASKTNLKKEQNLKRKTKKRKKSRISKKINFKQSIFSPSPWDLNLDPQTNRMLFVSVAHVK